MPETYSSAVWTVTSGEEEEEEEDFNTALVG
jgi:hypothetical protein